MSATSDYICFWDMSSRIFRAIRCGETAHGEGKAAATAARGCRPAAGSCSGEPATAPAPRELPPRLPRPARPAFGFTSSGSGQRVSSRFSCAEKLVQSLDAPKPKEIKPAAVSGCRSSLSSNKCRYQGYKAKVLLRRLGDFLHLGFLLTSKLAKSMLPLFA